MYVCIHDVSASLQGAINASQPNCFSGSCDNEAMDEILVANSSLVENLLNCFLVDPNCTLFQNVLTRTLAKNHLYQRMPLRTHAGKGRGNCI